MVAVAEGQLLHGLGGGAALGQDVERGEEAGAVRAGLAMGDGRIFKIGEEVLGLQENVASRRHGRLNDERHEGDAVALARLALERPGAMAAAAAQIDDRAHAGRREGGDLLRGRLRRAPQLVRDLVVVEIDEPEGAVIGEDHVRPGQQAIGDAGKGLAPASDAGFPAGAAEVGRSET